jgi:two-component sensor histidine kinase
VLNKVVQCVHAAIAVLWIEFVREVRWYWDEGRTLPRMSPNARPDLSTCLLHQKLQLLALCIEEKARRQGVGGGQMTAPQGEDEQASTETQEEPDVSEVLETARMSSTAIDQIHDDLSTGNDRYDCIVMSFFWFRSCLPNWVNIVCGL